MEVSAARTFWSRLRQSGVPMAFSLSRISGAIVVTLSTVVGAIHAADSREPSAAESIIEIRQSLIDTGVNDETTSIDVVVRNNGKLPATEVVVRGPIPKDYVLRSAIPATDKRAADLQWTFDQIDAGETKRIRLQFAPSPGELASDLRVELRVDFRGSAASSIYAPMKQLPPRFAVLVPASCTVGVPAAVKIQINSGKRPARNVVLQASLGAGLSNVGGRELENDLGTFEAGQTRTIRLELIPTRGGELRGKIRVRSEGSAWAEQEFTLSVGQVGLTVSTSAPLVAELKSQLPVLIAVTNDGSEPAKRVRLLVRLPAGLIHDTSPGGTYVAEDHFTLFDLGELKPGEKRAMRVTLKAAAVGVQTVRAILSSEAGEPRAHSVAIEVRDGTTGGVPVGKGP